MALLGCALLLASLAHASDAAAGAGSSGPKRRRYLIGSYANGDRDIYRIPAVVNMNGTLLAFAEARSTGSDWGHIDIFMKVSRDAGKSWTPRRLVVGDPSSKQQTAFGNPTPIADEANGLLHLIYCMNNTGVFHMVSTDLGIRWSEPRDITSMVKRPGWGWFATGPGHGLRMRSGRLVVPFNTYPTRTKVIMETEQTHCAGSVGCAHYRPRGQITLRYTVWNLDDPMDVPLSAQVVGAKAPTDYAWAGDRSGVFYSDDMGATWHLGGQVLDHPGSSECMVEEVLTASGASELLMSFRVENMPGCRRFARSADGGLAFLPHYVPEECIPDPVCQGGLLSLGGGSVILTSGPGLATRRERLHIYKSRDRGETFDLMMEAHDGYTAYSDLVLIGETLDVWHVGVLFEDGEGLAFFKFNVAKPAVPAPTQPPVTVNDPANFTGGGNASEGADANATNWSNWSNWSNETNGTNFTAFSAPAGEQRPTLAPGLIPQGQDPEGGRRLAAAVAPPGQPPLLLRRRRPP